ncbi:FMN-binding protein [Tenacibaculum caenipelagi]|uniref:FMN-binding protein n=1 Tax=Tenacibaculum caenipelagi TaxID=1325435 RepID=A0A4R6TL34_9FLAO|nr:FMN-binding protein [Tenacibaculum caenipelagi]TDQ29750.1 FMN-binding protein [Tenacibaculum caenipelagi]
MKIHKLFPFLCAVAILGTLSFTIPKKLQKKVTKEINKTFDIENFKLDEIEISDDVNNLLVRKIEGDRLFKITADTNDLIGYVYIDKAPSKTDEFDYLILLDKNLIVAKAKVLIYREDYGGEIGSKRWLKQFNGKTLNDKLQYEKDIVAISGATISASSMTIAINTFLQNLTILHQNKVL